MATKKKTATKKKLLEKTKKASRARQWARAERAAKPTAKKSAKPTAKRRAKQAFLPSLCNTKRVQEILGKGGPPVSHVTIINLRKSGKITPVSDHAKQQGGGCLWDEEKITAFAKDYNPQQRNRA